MTKSLTANDKKKCEILSRIYAESYPLTLLECLPNIIPYKRQFFIEEALKENLIFEIIENNEIKYKISSIGLIWLKKNIQKLTKTQKKNWWYKIICHKLSIN